MFHRAMKKKTLLQVLPSPVRAGSAGKGVPKGGAAAGGCFTVGATQSVVIRISATPQII